MAKLSSRQKEKRRKKERHIQKVKKQNYARKVLAQIRKFDDPILRTICDEVIPGAHDLAFIDDMKRVLCLSKTGIGLSAPQIGQSLSVYITRLNPKTNLTKTYINPTISGRSAAKRYEREGCLSYPHITANIERHVEVTIEYLDERYQPQTEKLTGLAARVAQHELEHLDGICQVGDKWKTKQKPTTLLTH